jgi:hypothetical protein
MRTLLRSYLQDLGAEDRLVHIKVRAKQPLPAVLEKTPEKNTLPSCIVVAFQAELANSARR